MKKAVTDWEKGAFSLWQSPSILVPSPIWIYLRLLGENSESENYTLELEKKNF